METIDFNEVIKQNIEVVGGLIGVATSTQNGLVSKDWCSLKSGLVDNKPD